MHCGAPGLLLVQRGPGQLEILPDKEPASVFAGEARKLHVTFRNAGAETVDTQLSIQLYQATSATAVPAGKAVDWKKLRVLPGQTVLEFAVLDFPPVKAETKFIVQWQEDSHRVLGTTEVRVYPADLLAKLKTLAGDRGPGIFDPQNELKPLLKKLNVEFEDLEHSSLEHFSGRLAIIGPFQKPAPLREGLAAQLKGLASKSTAVVWLQPPLERKTEPALLPSFYSVRESTNAVVVVQPDLVADLAENPQAQLNLIYFCRLALNPRPAALPISAAQP